MTNASSANMLQNQNDLQSGEHLIDGQTINTLMNWTLGAVTLPLANPGGAAAGAPVLGARINQVTSVTTTNDSYVLPLGFAGMILSVINTSGPQVHILPNTLINPQTGIADTLINVAGASETFIAVGTAALVTFYCYAPG